MAGVEGSVDGLSLHPSGSMPSLAQLAASTHGNDWSALPHSLLGDVFRRVLEQQHTSLEDVVRAWQTLALVCKGWLLALRESTPLCLELTKPAHVSAAAARWLGRVPVEVLVWARTLALPEGADAELLGGQAFQRHSASVLRSLMHGSPAALPHLHHFARLKQVALFCDDASTPERCIDPAPFHQLPKLNCLTIAGYWGALPTAELPPRLKHLALSNYCEGHSLEVVLPPGMGGLELLSARADTVILDWLDVCARCEEVHVAAGLTVLGVGEETVARLVRRHGFNHLQDQLYKRVSAAMAEGERFKEASQPGPCSPSLRPTVVHLASLAFFDLALYSGPGGASERGPVVPIDPDDFLQTLRDDLLPLGVDVNPALEVHPEFVRDLPSPDACFVLDLVKQEAGKPKSMHFTTPITNAEVTLLTSQPVWRISWCDDERAAQVLADPQFLAHSATTLTDLLSIPLVQALDLRPFTNLLSLLGHLKDAELGPILRRLPRSLESLCLTAEGSEQAWDFDAGLVRHLRRLKELSLYGQRRHDLAALRRHVSMIRILNPVVAEGEAIGSGLNYVWPRRQAEGGDDSDSEGECSQCSEDSGESRDSFRSATSAMADSASTAGSSSPHAQPAAPAPAPPAAADPQRAAAAAGAGRGGDGDAGSSSDGDTLPDAAHGHRHGSGGAEDERHSKQACEDPYCPLHSGKSFLQVSVTDQRQHSTIHFSALLAARFQMLTITLSPEHPNARCVLLHEGSWKSALAALNDSCIDVLELNCQAASMVFRSSSLLYRLTEVSVFAAMRYVAEHYADIWMVKSWNGNTAIDGVHENSRGFALMRRSVAAAARVSGA